MAILIDCKSITNEIKEDIKNKITGKRKPRLYVVQVGDNPASNSYIKGKKKDCEVRCKDCYDNCKYAATQQEIEQYVGKWTKPYIKPVVKATKPTVEKAVEIPQDITKLAQLLNVKRDKVAYLVKEKKMSFDDVYRKLKQ